MQQVAKLSATVLILGESGTGKELLARLLHKESGRGDAPFIAVNMSAIPHELVESTLFGHERGSFTGAVKQQLGKFELAAGGTLFLDEIGDLRFDLQAKLLRAIQEGEIERVGGTKPIKTDFRLIAATNIDLERAVKDGRFREDLYYRINVIPIRMPPLRDRIEDLPELARLFLDRYKSKFRKPVKGVADSALKILASYWWPGNIRELENLIERLVAVSDKEWITDEDLPLEYHFAKLDGPASAASETRFQEACDTFERNFILRALEKSDWNVTATARYLGIPLSTLKHKMARLDLRDLAQEAARRLRPATGRSAAQNAGQSVGRTGQFLSRFDPSGRPVCVVSAHGEPIQRVRSTKLQSGAEVHTRGPAIGLFRQPARLRNIALQFYMASARCRRARNLTHSKSLSHSVV